MPKGKKVITTRLDRSLVEVAQKRVEDLLNKVGPVAARFHRVKLRSTHGSFLAGEQQEGG